MTIGGQVKPDVAMVGSFRDPAGSSSPGSDEDRFVDYLHNLEAVMQGASAHRKPRHPDGTLEVPLTEEQRYENIALMWPDVAKTCHDEILRARRRDAVDAPHGEQAVHSMCEDDESDECLNSLRQETRIRAAMDSESCRNMHTPTLFLHG